MIQATIRTPSAMPASRTQFDSHAAVPGILLAALSYQALLCFIHTHLFQMSTMIVALSELGIFVACAALLCKRCEMQFIALFCAMVAYFLILAIWRGQLDPKGFRDAMIPLLFFELGRQYGNIKTANRLVSMSVAIVLFFALFELFFIDEYSRIFNIYSYYVSQGTVLPGAGWAKDSVLSLNGIRPDGIGRTILPEVLGSHRISSIFLEPVSLGNYAVIIACWALSKRREEWRRTFCLMCASIVLIALSDSRYGLITLAVLIALRLALPRRTEMALIALPIICIAALLMIASNHEMAFDDNFLGRLTLGGRVMLDFDLPMIFGLAGLDLTLGDMGYPASLIHFGLPLCIVLWSLFWLIQMRDDRGVRLRAYAAVYVSLILCVSGSSMFALKSAGLLWFLLGSCATPGSAGKIDAEALPAPTSGRTRQPIFGGEYGS